MSQLTFENPVFRAYVLAAAIMILKAVSMSWLTVARMMKVNGGYRSPEDAKKTPLNPEPRPDQVGPNDYVDRTRRIHLNDLENIPFFLAAGFLFVFTDPAPWVAQLLFGTYVVTRIAHFFAYLSAVTHDTRAKLWTPGSLIIIGITVRVLVAAAGIA